MRSYPVQEKELTLLAEGSRYALIGDATGQVYRLRLVALQAMRHILAEPIYLRAPPPDASKVGSYRMIILPEMPPGTIIYCKYLTDEESGITIYVAFEKARNIWYLRELRDNEGRGTGKYYREAGGVRPPSGSP